jgi:hypothetical protein
MIDDLVTGSDGLGGPAGTRWRNMTDDTWYQLVSSLRKPETHISPLRPGFTVSGLLLCGW